MAEAQLEKGKTMLAEVALRNAAGHGLRPRIEWEDQGYQWLLRVIDAEHSVSMVFSPDEIEFFAEDLPENKETKMKIRNAFASLSM